MKKNKKFFEYEENQKSLIISLFVILILTGIELIKFLFSFILDLLKIPESLVTSIILIFPIPLLLWIMAINGENLLGFKENNLSPKLIKFSKIISLVILIQIASFLLLKIIAISIV